MARTPRHETDLPKRPSTRVDKRRLPGVRAREELNRLLRTHDPETAAQARAAIKPEQVPILRQIAREQPTGSGDPVVRKHAIALLGWFAGAEELNALTDLVHFDPDPSVRAAALISLGSTGMQLAAPILSGALASRDATEAAAAAKALTILARKVGPAAVRVQIGRPGTARTVKLAERILGAGDAPARPRRAKRARTRAD